MQQTRIAIRERTVSPIKIGYPGPQGYMGKAGIVRGSLGQKGNKGEIGFQGLAGTNGYNGIDAKGAIHFLSEFEPNAPLFYIFPYINNLIPEATSIIYNAFPFDLVQSNSSCPITRIFISNNLSNTLVSESIVLPTLLITLPNSSIISLLSFELVEIIYFRNNNQWHYIKVGE